jgi:molybdopterin molybdotransferase
MALLPVADALSRILDGARPTPTQTVTLREARTRILADDIKALLTQPPFDASAMDGYAVRAEDVAASPADLTVVGESQAGLRYDGRVGQGQAVRIFTGAPVPNGADTVVIQENCERQNGSVRVNQSAARAANMRSAGGDFCDGQTLLTAGSVLDAGAITLAAAGGHATLPVHTRPRVAILATGDELVEPGVAPGPDQIVCSNTYGLAALVERAGATAQLLGIAGDDRKDLEAKLAAAKDADILVTIGGASVGDRDLVRPALEALGMTLDFWKVAIRPGKPMLFGRLGASRVLGLPGNPLSCLIAARVFLVPLIHRLLGRSEGPAGERTALVTHDLPANGSRQHYIRAKLSFDAKGCTHVTVLPTQDSAFITGLVAADALLVRAPDSPVASAGAPVTILPLDL